jgi:DNA-binding response OmpR family regulator
MVNVRPHSGSEVPGGEEGAPLPGCEGGRLNLLLSYAGWHPESWADRLPRLLEPMGIRAVRATTGRQASEVISATPIHIAVVDLGLPLDDAPGRGAAEEGGAGLLELLSRLSCPPPVVAVKRGRTHRDDGRELAAALRLGAFAVIDRPRGSGDLEILLDVMRRALRRFYQGRWPV